jgi:hypothetical protein
VSEDLVQGERKDDACANAAAETHCSRPVDYTEHMAALRAERHADAELACSLSHCVGNNTVKSNSGQGKPESGKRAEGPRDEPLLLPLRLTGDPVIEVADIAIERLIRVDGIDLFAD